jgi:hypothetical protein
MHCLPRSTLLAALLMFAPLAHAQTAVDPSGRWEGKIQAPDRDVTIEIDLVKNSNGEVAGRISIPAQQLKGLSLVSFAGNDRSIGFQIKGAPGERLFKGVLSTDGRSISGEYTQLGYTMPFQLTRTGEPTIETPVKSPAVGSALAGTWIATMNVKGTERRLQLVMWNEPDGTATGSMLNVDEGLDIPIARIIQAAASLTLEITSVGGSYSGTLNADGTELAGTLTQGSATLPLTFRRAGAADRK